MKVTDLELRSHSEHKLCPAPPDQLPPERVWEGFIHRQPCSLDLVPSWAVTGRCGLHGPSLDLWKWQECAQAHHAGPGHPPPFCQKL